MYRYHRRASSAAGAALLAATMTALLAAPAHAQEDSGEGRWRFALGGGAGVALSGHDMTDAGEAGVAVLVTAGTPLRIRGLGLDLRWVSTWVSSRLGGDHRHHLGAALGGRPGGGPVRVRLGAGFGLVTVVEADFPEPGTIGDGVVSVGDFGSVDATAGAALDLPVAGSFSFGPAVDLLVQRADRRTFTTLVLSGRLTLDALR